MPSSASVLRARKPRREVVGESRCTGRRSEHVGDQTAVESFPVAAYELREFKNQLPRIVDVPRISHADLAAKARTLPEKWKNCDHLLLEYRSLPSASLCRNRGTT